MNNQLGVTFLLIFLLLLSANTKNSESCGCHACSAPNPKTLTQPNVEYNIQHQK